MAIEVEMDEEVRKGFFYWERWPNELLDAIAAVKKEIYDKLAPHPLYPDTLVTNRVFALSGIRYDVICAVEKAHAGKNVFRIMRIDRLG